MKYVSEIVNKDGKEIEGVVFSSYYDAPAVRVYDTESGLTAAFDVREVEKIEALGYSRHAVGGMFSVVRHTQKTVDLHRFVKRTHTMLGTRELIMYDVDMCILSDGHADVSRVEGRSCIAVHLVRDMINLAGNSGSIVSRQFGMFGAAKVFTLYDLMYSLSKECHLNLFCYDKIQFYSKRQNFTSVVELDHVGEEAERYFMKVLIDLGRL